jgi:hypothetical protein
MPVKARLVACSACARHVRVDECACPFCGAACSAPVGPAPKPPPGRLTRAELFVYGTVGALAIAACDQKPNAPPPPSHPKSADEVVADLPDASVKSTQRNADGGGGRSSLEPPLDKVVAAYGAPAGSGFGTGNTVKKPCSCDAGDPLCACVP